MRILLINDSANPNTGAQNRLVIESCDWLAKKGHEVGLIYHDEHEMAATCKSFHVPERWPMRQRLLELNRVVETFRPQVLQNHSSKILPALPALASRYPTCVYLHNAHAFCSAMDRMWRNGTSCHRRHSLNCLSAHYAKGCGSKNPASNWQRWRATQEHIQLRQVHNIRFQVPSRFLREGLLENRFPESRIDVVPPFIQAPVCEEVLVPGLMLAPGNLTETDGISLALEAAAKMINVPWSLVVMGDGPLRDELQALARRLGIERRVQWVGNLPITERSQWFCRAQFVLIPSRRPDPFSLVGLEAFAHGRPVVTFDAGAVHEWLTADETGLIVSKYSAALFSNSMEELLNNPARCRLMGASARVRSADFHPAIYADHLVSSLEKCQSDFLPKKTP